MLLPKGKLVLLVLLVAASAILASLWILAHDPTIQLLRRRIRLNAELKQCAEDQPSADVVAVLPQADFSHRRHKRRRRR